MQEANVSSGTQEPLVPAKLLQSMHDLNHRFLDLVATRAADWNSTRVGLSLEVSGQIAPLTPEQKRAAASCPYALFDLRFDDETHWLTRLGEAGRQNVFDAGPLDEHTMSFVRLALFFAWHVAATGKLASRLLLGMSDATVTTFREATIDCLPGLAVTEAGNLTARWSTRSSYWSALTVAAARPNPAALRRIQLSGLQLTAAAHLF